LPTRLRPHGAVPTLRLLIVFAQAGVWARRCLRQPSSPPRLAAKSAGASGKGVTIPTVLSHCSIGRLLCREQDR